MPWGLEGESSKKKRKWRVHSFVPSPEPVKVHSEALMPVGYRTAFLSNRGSTDGLAEEPEPPIEPEPPGEWDQTGLQMWFDASDTATFTFSGAGPSGAYTAWQDKSPKARHLNTTAGTTLRTTTAAGINGLATIDSTAGYGYRSIADLQIHDLVDQGDSKSWMAFAVIRQVDVAYPNQGLVFGAAGGQTYEFNLFNQGPGPWSQFVLGTPGVGAGTTYIKVERQAGNAYLVTYTRQGDVDTVRQNGMTVPTDTGSGLAGVVGSALATLTVGGGSSGSHKGLLGEYIHIARYNQAQRDQIEAYLTAKWFPPGPTFDKTGLQLWLDANDVDAFTYLTALLKPGPKAGEEIIPREEPEPKKTSGGVHRWLDKGPFGRYTITNNLTERRLNVLNGKPGVWNWVHTENQFDISTLFDGSGNAMTFCVIKPENASNSIYFYAVNPTNGICIGASESGIQEWYGAQATTIWVATVPPVSTTVPALYTVTRNGATIRKFRNGAQVFQKTDASGLVTSGISNIQVGIWNGVTGLIGEAIHVARFDAAQQASIEGYLMGKWGITPSRSVPKIVLIPWLLAQGIAMSASALSRLTRDELLELVDDYVDDETEP